MKDAPGHMATDRIIVQQVLDGKRDAFSIIIETTGNLVAQIIYRTGVPVAEQKDLTQDIYLKVYRELKRFRFQSKLSTWVAQIAFNTCADYLAKKKISIVAIEEAVEKYSSEVGEQPLERKEDAALLARAMGSLPPLYRTLIALYHQEEISYEDIAQITGLPMGTVKNYLFRARKLLKEKL